MRISFQGSARQAGAWWGGALLHKRKDQVEGDHVVHWLAALVQQPMVPPLPQLQLQREQRDRQRLAVLAQMYDVHGTGLALLRGAGEADGAAPAHRYSTAAEAAGLGAAASAAVE